MNGIGFHPNFYVVKAAKLSTLTFESLSLDANGYLQVSITNAPSGSITPSSLFTPVYVSAPLQRNISNAPAINTIATATLANASATTSLIIRGFSACAQGGVVAGTKLTITGTGVSLVYSIQNDTLISVSDLWLVVPVSTAVTIAFDTAPAGGFQSVNLWTHSITNS